MYQTEHKNQRFRNQKRRHRRNLTKVFFFTLITLLTAGLLMVVGWRMVSPFSPEAPHQQGAEQGNGGSSDNPNTADIDLNHLYSPYSILMDLDSERIIAEHNSQDRIYPASLTKIMTAILVIENTDDFSQTITLSNAVFQSLYEQNASMAGFQPGETVSYKDLLYGILLPSGAECCMALAERIAGSESQFADLMNQKAKELGMKHTHFCNVTGLHDPDHYSTVEDISILLQYALKNEMFRAAFTCKRYSTSPSNQHPDGFTFRSTMFKYMDSTVVTGGEMIGGKTGYTEEAGLCLASLAKVSGKEYILVTAKANGTHQTEQFHILDAINVYSQVGEQASRNQIRTVVKIHGRAGEHPASTPPTVMSKTCRTKRNGLGMRHL